MTTESSARLEVRRDVSVPLAPQQAFDLFATRMTDFWPSGHSIGASDIAEVVIEPGVGGRWFERGVDGVECPWGRVAAWEPPRRLVLLWQITAEWAYDPDFETEVELNFVAESPGRTRLELCHRGIERYGTAAHQMREVFGSPYGWTGTLERFAERASG